MATSTIVVKKCSCKGNPSLASDYQDKKYGYGMRVMNTTFKKDSVICTICDKEYRISSDK